MLFKKIALVGVLCLSLNFSHANIECPWGNGILGCVGGLLGVTIGQEVTTKKDKLDALAAIGSLLGDAIQDHINNNSTEDDSTETNLDNLF